VTRKNGKEMTMDARLDYLGSPAGRPDPLTGATGLIGSTVTRLLRSRGDDVAALSRNRGPPRTGREAPQGTASHANTATQMKSRNCPMAAMSSAR